MQIRIGDYEITSDSWSVMVTKEGVSKPSDKNPEGKPKKDLVGYYPRLSMALEGILERQIRDSEATTVQQLLTEIQAAKEAILGVKVSV